MIQNLYSESEQDIDRTLLSLSCLVDKDYGLIKKLKEFVNIMMNLNFGIILLI